MKERNRKLEKLVLILNGGGEESSPSVAKLDQPDGVEHGNGDRWMALRPG